MHISTNFQNFPSGVLNVKPMGEFIAVDIDFGERKTKGGIILKDDDFKEDGIRYREARVLAVGPKVDQSIKPGDRLLLEHGGWTRNARMRMKDGVERKIWFTQEKFILLVIED